MRKCVDCTLPTSAGRRCGDCAAEVAETPHWRAPEPREPQSRRGGRRPGPVRICSVENCEARARRLIGYCEKHFYRWQRHGDPMTLTRRPKPDKQCATCGISFHPWRMDARFCSTACYRASVPPRPIECMNEGCSRPRRNGIAYCGPCEEIKWPRDPEKLKAAYRAANHRRRARRRQALGQFDWVTPAYELALRQAARKCPLCDVRLIEEPYRHASKELDHMVPLNVGGTHTTGNVRIICRLCNLRRPDDGSDYTGPVTLWATA